MDTPLPSTLLEAEIAALRLQLAALRFDLAGKDWLTVEEAAHYCGVSTSQFNAKTAEYGLEPRRFMGKKLYEKAALYRSISDAKEWTPRRLTGSTSVPKSPEMAALASYEKRRSKT